jgi:hypothetical protein
MLQAWIDAVSGGSKGGVDLNGNLVQPSGFWLEGCGEHRENLAAVAIRSGGVGAVNATSCFMRTAPRKVPNGPVIANRICRR